jgi:hypothetical protein
VSHHRDSPTSRKDSRLNVTDNYVFDGESGTVFVMATNTSLAGEARTGGFHPEARYEFKVHLDRADAANLTFRFTFGEPGSDGSQPLSVSRLSGADASDDAAAGSVIADGSTGTTLDGTDGSRVWAGPAKDPFFLDLNELGHIIAGLQSERPIDLGDWAPSTAASSFTGSHVDVIVLEVPRSDADLNDGRDIGTWSVTKLATDAGGWRQINRSAIPMMWPLFRAVGDADDSDRYSESTSGRPVDDETRDGARIATMIGAAARATGTRNPEAYTQTVVARLLPDLLPYQVGTPASFSFAGFNGRCLDDNAPEVMYSLVTNTGFSSGLRAADAAETRSASFPYVVPTAESA